MSEEVPIDPFGGVTVKKNISIYRGFMVAFLALITLPTGVFVVNAFRSNSSIVMNAGKQKPTVPSDWIMIEIQKEVSLFIPSDMKRGRLIGDSPAYRESYINPDLQITISYGSLVPTVVNQSDGRFEQCQTPASLAKEPTYSETLVDIDGTKAKVGINRYHQPNYIIANVCFGKVDGRKLLRIAADCKGERGLAVAQQIFSSIKFKDR